MEKNIIKLFLFIRFIIFFSNPFSKRKRDHERKTCPFSQASAFPIQKKHLSKQEKETMKEKYTFLTSFSFPHLKKHSPEQKKETIERREINSPSHKLQLSSIQKNILPNKKRDHRKKNTLSSQASSFFSSKKAFSLNKKRDHRKKKQIFLTSFFLFLFKKESKEKNLNK